MAHQLHLIVPSREPSWRSASLMGLHKRPLGVNRDHCLTHPPLRRLPPILCVTPLGADRTSDEPDEQNVRHYPASRFEERIVRRLQSEPRTLAQPIPLLQHPRTERQSGPIPEKRCGYTSRHPACPTGVAPRKMHDLLQRARPVGPQARTNYPPEQLHNHSVRDATRALAALVGCRTRCVTAQSVVAVRVRTPGPRWLRTQASTPAAARTPCANCWPSAHRIRTPNHSIPHHLCFPPNMRRFVRLGTDKHPFIKQPKNR
jgi:hypothetical protein